MRMALALVNAVWSTRGVLRGCWQDCDDSLEGMREWTYSANWHSRER